MSTVCPGGPGVNTSKSAHSIVPRERQHKEQSFHDQKHKNKKGSEKKRSERLAGWVRKVWCAV